MRSWQLGINDPHDLVIAADARMVEVDYCDDQIWEVDVAHGNPPAFAFQTSYGMRAVSMRFFPIFSTDEVEMIDPFEYHRPPVLVRFYPNYLKLDCAKAKSELGPSLGRDYTRQITENAFKRKREKKKKNE